MQGIAIRIGKVLRVVFLYHIVHIPASHTVLRVNVCGLAVCFFSSVEIVHCFLLYVHSSPKPANSVD